jgi:hypothetical protein
MGLIVFCVERSIGEQYTQIASQISVFFVHQVEYDFHAINWPKTG